ncbi:transporter substrate-binding domain-containing protein [Peptostreptococcus canis]|uniref:Transporter substrate-binding domain-containing protein n=1 Tax=Peptostreptococcus canis TaxID=1159213 RepID=A0ABR6TLF6_9FIRM|nr:transporter substrate-binding domain-containing protein [Peptostreptococcus canis]MBC2576246.1 transporter substrate-binding domain-containing protein [Peptostreptococcus canis]MBP1998219.1 polar amino acid transport system substrate-binding protein [Peptostreptococcus canis]
MKKMAKFISIVLIMAISISVAACSKSDVSDKVQNNKLQMIKDKGKLVVGTSPAYPPFEFVIGKGGKSEVVGADIDLSKKIAEKLGVELEISTMDFDTIIPSLNSGKIDIAVTGMTPTEERKKSVDFSDIYFEGVNSVVVNESFKGDIKNESDLKNLKIGVQKGSTQEIYAKEILKAEKVKSLNTVLDLVMDMKNGNLDAVIMSDIVAKINKKQTSGIKIIENIELKGDQSSETAAVALKKGDNEELLKEINSVIKELKDSGEYDKILNKNIDTASKVH